MKKIPLLLSYIFLTFSFSSLQAQVTIGTNNPPQSFSILELDAATTKGGLRLPQLSTAERNALPIIGSQLANGLTIFNTTESLIQYWDGMQWVNLRDSNPGWSLYGNPGTDPLEHFIGTTDNSPLNFRISNLASGTISTSNTALGFFSFRDNLEGLSNTAIGTFTLSRSISAHNNTAIGASAMMTMYTGAHNTAIGVSALNFNESGNGNTGIGGFALQQNSGSENTALGLYAGSTGEGSNNIYIGANTSLDESANNQMNIGNIIFGSDMTGRYDSPTGRIGINTTKPGNTLEVNAIESGKSGLRFKQLNSESSTVSSPEPKVLSVNKEGDVVLVSTTRAWSAKESLVITATGTDPVVDASINFIRYRELGNNEIEVDFKLVIQDGSNSTRGEGFYLFELPNGYKFDVSEHPLFPNNDMDRGLWRLAEYVIRDSWSVSDGTAGKIMTYDESHFCVVWANGYRIGSDNGRFQEYYNVCAGTFKFTKQ